MTLTSTYDHRIIQGAESGMFLKAVHERLMGEHDYYHDVFRSLGVPYEEVKWRRDVSPLDREEALLHKQMQVATLIRAYRARGHRIADLDPLDWKEPAMPDELDPATYGLTIWDLDREFLTGGVAGKDRMHLGDLLGVLRDAYCRSIGIEYMHIQDTDEQRWIQSKVEGIKVQLSSDELRHLLERLNAAEALERFLATKYVGTKRFGLEGAESAIPILDKVLSAAADSGLDGSVIGMAHRGRLNVLANIVGKSYDQIFREFEGYVDPTSVQGSGDVKYHLGAVGKYVSPSGADIKVELAANPSHLETVDPIVLGMVRAKQDQIDPPGSYPWLSILIHGDAAFAGQGVVAECLAMSDIVGYRVGGTIHLIINNQIGFTTSPQFARSSPYCTDMAKMLQSPHLPRERRRPGGLRARRRASPSSTGSGSTRTSSSTWSATAGRATTRATTRATRSRSCTRPSPSGAACASCSSRPSSSGASSRWTRRRRPSPTSSAACRSRSTRPARARPRRRGPPSRRRRKGCSRTS